MGTKDYAVLLQRDRRLAILRALSTAQGFGANESQLERICNALKVWSDRAEIIKELKWLDRKGYVILEDIEGYTAATATDDGVNIAKGIKFHPEITAPSAPRKLKK